MGLCLGKTISSSPWPYLPPEIAGLILARLPSHDDRLSFSAVCRNWRLAAQQESPILPPALPYISLGGGTYQSIADGKVRRTSRGVVSFGSRLMYERGGRIYLRDPSSSVKIEIPRCYHRCTDHRCDDGGAHDPCVTAGAWRLIGPAAIGNAMHKLVVCSPRLVAAIVYPAVGRSSESGAAYSFAFFRPGATSQLSWALCTPVHHQYRDMVLYRDKIFALSFREGLFVHELGQPCHAEHVIKKHAPPPPLPVIYTYHYMLVSFDGRKLLMVRWAVTHGNQMNLQVFEADLERGEWTEVKDLNGQVLFLSKTCSRALAAGSSTELYDRGGNRVFILGIDWARAQLRMPDRDMSVDGIPSYCVYDMMSGRLDLVSLPKVSRMRNPRSEWFFPSD